MRHRKKQFKLGRNVSHRKAMFANMATSLIMHERITTTVPKAKAIRPFVEKLVTLARKGELHHLRQAMALCRDKTAVKKLFDVLGPRFKDRDGGYTRIVRLGGSRWVSDEEPKWAGNRLGDNAPRAIIEFVVREEVETSA